MKKKKKTIFGFHSFVFQFKKHYKNKKIKKHENNSFYFTTLMRSQINDGHLRSLG